MSWHDRSSETISATCTSRSRGIAVAAIAISPSEAFGIMTNCRESLEGEAHAQTSQLTGVRLWVFRTADGRDVVLACDDGEFSVRTRVLNAEALDAA